MCAKDNFYFCTISRKTKWKYAVRTVNHEVRLRTANPPQYKIRIKNIPLVYTTQHIFVLLCMLRTAYF